MNPLRRVYLRGASAALAVGAQLLGSDASAHIELLSPLNRYSDIKIGDNKACPCGSGTTNRSCRKPEELSDPDRSSDRATTFAPGETISVRFDEYVGHSGRFRIAFDPDGADLQDFNQNILMDEPDPSGNVGNLGQRSLWEFQVTLPDMICDNCTLQLIQVMDGNTTDPVLDPVERGGTYFQCADLILATGTAAGGIAPEAPSAHPGARGRPHPIAAALPSSTTMAMGSGTDVVSDGSDAATQEDGGCSVVGGARSNGAKTALTKLAGLFVAVAVWARRGTRGCAATTR